MAWMLRVLASKFHCGGELMPEYGPLIGKGDAMWKALSIARGDLVAYVDVEAPVYEPHFVCGSLDRS